MITGFRLLLAFDGLIALKFVVDRGPAIVVLHGQQPNRLWELVTVATLILNGLAAHVVQIPLSVASYAALLGLAAGMLVQVVPVGAALGSLLFAVIMCYCLATGVLFSRHARCTVGGSLPYGRLG